MEANILKKIEGSELRDLIKIRDEMTEFHPGAKKFLSSAIPRKETCVREKFVSIPIITEDYFATLPRTEILRREAFFIKQSIKYLYLVSYDDLRDKQNSGYCLSSNTYSSNILAQNPDLFKFKNPIFMTTDNLRLSIIFGWDIDYIIGSASIVESYLGDEIEKLSDRFHQEAVQLKIRGGDDLMEMYQQALDLKK